MRFAISSILTLSLLLSVAGGAQAASVVGDDGQDRYVESGSLILPGSAGDATRQQVAHCPDCRWRFQDPCPARFANESQVCAFTPMPCAPEETLLLLVLSTDGGVMWEGRGMVCVGQDGPIPVAAVEREVRDRVEQGLPPIALRHQPARGIVPRLPVTLHSGQNIPPFFDMQVLGMQVRITPSVRWQWGFSDGTIMDTDQPGSTYPDLAVSHTFRRPGKYQITCTATWQASYLVDGLGPFPVAPIQQEAVRTVRVHDGRASLVAPPRSVVPSSMAH